MRRKSIVSNVTGSQNEQAKPILRSGDVENSDSGAENRTGNSCRASEEKQSSITLENSKTLLASLTNDYRWQELLPPPSDMNGLISGLFADLQEVPVVNASGSVTNVYEKIESDGFLARQDKDLIWSCLAMARDMFHRLENSPDNESPGYQWDMNWKHTRAELDQVFEAARRMRLNAKETRDAMIASIFSDSVKNRGNFVIHNIHGGEAAALALSYLLDLRKPSSAKSLERVVRACREHQIAPPEFMARVVAIMLHNKLQLGRFVPPTDTDNDNEHTVSGAADADDIPAVRSIYRKIRSPFDKSHLTEDLRRIDFTPKERELLALLSIEEWYVPHPEDPGSRIGHAVIAGDHSINYNNPEGFAKIALIRGPDTESIFEDPTVYHSLESAMDSFTDSFRVICPEAQSLALVGLRRTRSAVSRVTAIMTEIFNGIVVGPRSDKLRFSGQECLENAIERAHEKHPALFEVDSGSLCEAGTSRVEEALERVASLMDQWYQEHGSIPFSPKSPDDDQPGPGSLPFWNAPLKYPERDKRGRPDLCSLNELEMLQFKFADRIRKIAVELLRAEQWIYACPKD